MSLENTITLEKAQEALDKIRRQFEPNDAHLTIVTPDLYQDVYDVVKNHYIPDEPISHSIGLQWSYEIEMILNKTLSENVSLCALHKDTKEVMGIRVCSVMKKGDQPMVESLFTDKKIRTLVRFVTQKDDEVDCFNRLVVDEVFHFYILGVCRKYRQKHIGSVLLNAAVAFASELGYKAVKGEGTSKFSQKIYQKAGFDVVATLPYDEFVTPWGWTLRDGTGEHTDLKIYTLKLP